MADEAIIVRDGRKYKNLVTDVGRTKIALAALEGRKVNIIEMALGDGAGAYYLPTADATALKREVWRGKIAHKEINKDSSNMIDVRTVLDSTVGGFTVREAGLFDDEGDMIVVGNLPEIEKAIILEGISSSLTILLHVIFSNAEAVEITVNRHLDAVSKEEMERAISAAVKRSVVILDVIIPTGGWEASNKDEPTGLRREIPIPSVTADMGPSLVVYPNDMDTARDCGFSSYVRTVEEAIRVYAASAPMRELRARLTLHCASKNTVSGGVSSGFDGALPTASETRLGGVIIGDGLSITPEGMVSVDGESVVEGMTATETDVKEMLNRVFGDPKP